MGYRRPFSANWRGEGQWGVIAEGLNRLETFLNNLRGDGDVEVDLRDDGAVIRCDTLPAEDPIANYAFRCRLSKRDPGEGEGEDQINVVRIRPGQWSTGGSGGTTYPPSSTPSATESQWTWANGEMMLDIPFGEITSGDGYVFLVFNFVRSDRALPELWWSHDSSAPADIIADPDAVPPGDNAVRYWPLCKVTKTTTGSGEDAVVSYSILPMQIGNIRLYVPPYASPAISRGMIATLNPIRAQAAPDDYIYVYDDSTPPVLEQVTAVGGEEYYDSEGNPVYSSKTPWVADWLRFADDDNEIVFEPPLEPEA